MLKGGEGNSKNNKEEIQLGFKCRLLPAITGIPITI